MTFRKSERYIFGKFASMRACASHIFIESRYRHAKNIYFFNMFIQMKFVVITNREFLTQNPNLNQIQKSIREKHNHKPINSHMTQHRKSKLTRQNCWKMITKLRMTQRYIILCFLNYYKTSKGIHNGHVTFTYHIHHLKSQI